LKDEVAVQSPSQEPEEPRDMSESNAGGVGKTDDKSAEGLPGSWD